jgi:hypothetical protein
MKNNFIMLISLTGNNMAKKKNIETKTALLRYCFSNKLNKIDEEELDEWFKEQIQQNKNFYTQQQIPWTTERLSCFNWFDR